MLLQLVVIFFLIYPYQSYLLYNDYGLRHKNHLISFRRSLILGSKKENSADKDPLLVAIIKDVDAYDFQDLYYSGFLSSKLLEDVSRYLNVAYKPCKLRSIGGHAKAIRRKLIIADTRKASQGELLASLEESDLLGALSMTFSAPVNKDVVLNLLSASIKLSDSDIGDVIDVKMRKEWLIIMPNSLIHDTLKIRIPPVGDIKILQTKTVDLNEIPSILSKSLQSSNSPANNLPIVTNQKNSTDASPTTPKLSLQEKEMTLIENSLRLDAVISGGLSMSRTALTRLIEDNKVYIDGQRALTPSLSIKEGQTVVVRSIGKVVIEEVAETNKGKYRIKCKRIKDSTILT